MQKRPFGKTGHLSSVAIFGSACLHHIHQDIADRAIELALANDINTIDTAPAYGDSEKLLGTWIEKNGKPSGKGFQPPFFLATKNGHRDRLKARKGLHRSLKRLKVEVIDLYQFHSVTSMADLDQITGPKGALEVFLEAKQQGLIRHMGITGHGPAAPAVFLEALQRMDLDSILFSVFPRLLSDPLYREKASQLLAECRRKNIAVIAINATVRGPWGSDRPRYYSWYRPFDEPEQIQECVNFVLSQDVTAYATIADLTLLLPNIQACEHFTPMSLDEQEAVIDRSRSQEMVKFF
jgi:aryl-alcohol dehydrogenase-like predicted oxidoreductase